MVLISLLVFSSLHHVTHVRTDAIPCPSHLSPTTADVATSCFPAFELPTRWGPVWAKFTLYPIFFSLKQTIALILEQSFIHKPKGEDGGGSIEKLVNAVYPGLGISP